MIARGRLVIRAFLAMGATTLILACGSVPASAPAATDLPGTVVPATEVPGTDDLATMTVGEALAAYAAGTLPGGRATIRGFWSNGSVGHSCAPAMEPLGELELYCVDGEWGITERQEPILVVDRFGYVTYEAAGPHLTPWFPSELSGAEELFNLPFINGQRFPPVPIVVVGHFDDPRAEQCRAEKRQLCLDRLVVDQILQFDVGAVATPGVTAEPTPFPSPAPSGLFAPKACSGDIPYEFVGWTTPAELGIDRGWPDEHIWAVITRDPVDRTDGEWQDDPNGSGHRYLRWAQLICFAEESPHYEGEMGFESVPGTEVIHWDDGLTTPGSDPIRPPGSS